MSWRQKIFLGAGHKGIIKFFYKKLIYGSIGIPMDFRNIKSTYMIQKEEDEQYENCSNL